SFFSLRFLKLGSPEIAKDFVRTSSSRFWNVVLVFAGFMAENSDSARNDDVGDADPSRSNLEPIWGVHETSNRGGKYEGELLWSIYSIGTTSATSNWSRS
ncbi:hypothetical protein LINPERPRIM_LOCUS17458, partial [Linum perenne]